MVQERLSMRETREILRLKLRLNRNNSETAASVRRARSTAWDCVTRARAAGITSWEEVEKLSDAELECRLYPKSPCGVLSRAIVRPLPDWAEVMWNSSPFNLEPLSHGD